MPGDAQSPQQWALGFALALARFGSAFVFVPMPGLRAGPAAARALLVLTMTLAAAPLWRGRVPEAPTPGRFAAWMCAELLFGLGAGLAVAFLSEALVFGMQVFALQAGFSYASAINPASEADSSVLEVVAQLGAGLLFFVCGADRLVLAAFARSLEVWPPGSAGVPGQAAARIIALGTSMMELGLRLALPVAALLLLADVTLALLGRIQTQLQLLTLAFPVKTLGALAVLAALAPLVPVLYRSGLAWAGSALGALVR